MILVQGFCPLKIEITQFSDGLCLEINLASGQHSYTVTLGRHRFYNVADSET